MLKEVQKSQSSCNEERKAKQKQLDNTSSTITISPNEVGINTAPQAVLANKNLIILWNLRAHASSCKAKRNIQGISQLL